MANTETLNWNQGERQWLTTEILHKGKSLTLQEYDITKGDAVEKDDSKGQPRERAQRGRAELVTDFREGIGREMLIPEET